MRGEPQGAQEAAREGADDEWTERGDERRCSMKDYRRWCSPDPVRCSGDDETLIKVNELPELRG